MSPDRGGRPLSGTATAGGARLDRIGVAHGGERPGCAGVFAHERGTAGAGARSDCVAALHQGVYSGARSAPRRVPRMSRSGGYDDERLPLSRTPPVAEDVRRELEFHLEQRVAELMRSGVPREEGPGSRAHRSVTARASRRNAGRSSAAAGLRGGAPSGWARCGRISWSTPGAAQEPGLTRPVLTLALRHRGHRGDVQHRGTALLLRSAALCGARPAGGDRGAARGAAAACRANLLDLEARARSFSAMTYGA
jgi:hypothetical protein